MAKLRPYQQDLLEKSQAALSPEGARVMTQLPTGGGKTEIAGALLQDFLVDGRKAVWLTHREELAHQTEERLSSNWSVTAMAGTDSWRPRHPAPRIVNGVVILKAQTVNRRNKDAAVVWDNYSPDDLLVIDEAHHAPATGWKRAIEQWPGKVWGLTATPWRLSRREGFDHLFDTLVTGPQTAEMQANGYLAASRLYAPAPDDWIKGGEVGKSGDFTEGGIGRANDQLVMTTLAVNFWQNMADGRQTIAYAVSKVHAANLVGKFQDRGFAAAEILSNTAQDERKRAIADFKAGRLTVLVNVAVATEGFDLPDASCVMITRPTKSLALYLQMAGRGLRPKPDGGDCLILDLAGNAAEHGLPEYDREWSLAARGNPEPGELPVRYCHECGLGAHPAHHKCPQCGADLGQPCPRCGKFRPWSRWAQAEQCPIEPKHEAVCDYCHDDVHDPVFAGRDSWFYIRRADEHGKDGNLEAALADYWLAIYAWKPNGVGINNVALPYTYMNRGGIHYRMGNIEFAYADFAEVDTLLGSGEGSLGLPPIYQAGTYRARAKVYEELGHHDKAELDRQKAKELKDIITAGSNAGPV